MHYENWEFYLLFCSMALDAMNKIKRKKKNIVFDEQKAGKEKEMLMLQVIYESQWNDLI